MPVLKPIRVGQYLRHLFNIDIAYNIIVLTEVPVPGIHIQFCQNTKHYPNLRKDVTSSHTSTCAPAFHQRLFWSCKCIFQPIDNGKRVWVLPHIRLHVAVTSPPFSKWDKIYRVFSWGGLGGPPIRRKFCQSPPSDTCPRFWTKACPPQLRFVPENLKNLNTFLCQIWLLLSSKVP